MTYASFVWSMSCSAVSGTDGELIGARPAERGADAGAAALGVRTALFSGEEAGNRPADGGAKAGGGGMAADRTSTGEGTGTLRLRADGVANSALLPAAAAGANTGAANDASRSFFLRGRFSTAVQQQHER